VRFRLMSKIAQRRLEHQHLVAPTLTEAAAVVRTLGAVQAQDYGGAKWGVAQRTQGLTDADVERAVVAGDILRTHVLRPTWHFVHAKDARWMLELTAPRIRAAAAYHHQKWSLDAKTFRKSHGVLERALRDGRHLTRTELRAALRRASIDVSAGERVGHLLMQAELDRLIIGGARRGKQFTYALFDARVATSPPRARDEALCDLTSRYFATRGPATLHDFAWWSGLTVSDATRGVAIAADALECETIDGSTYWYAPSTGASRRRLHIAHLLPNYDEYFIGFTDRSEFAERVRVTRATWRPNALRGHMVVVNGQIVGGWRRTLGESVEVELDLLVSLTSAEHRLVERAAERFGAFLGMPVRVRV
jgi:DNA glycosylase AlkZ-like